MNNPSGSWPAAADAFFTGSLLFSLMTKAEFKTVAAFWEYNRVEKNMTLFKEGDAGKDMFILLSGALSAFVSQLDGTQRWMFDIKAGDFFGEMSVIANEPRSATVIAREDAQIMVLRGDDFYRILFEYPFSGIKLLKAIGKVQNAWFDQTSRHLSDILRWGETARRRAITDELTGIYNRRFLEESLNDRFERGAVGLRKIALMMLDLDRIHAVNETYGSRAGDLIIITVADILRSLVRAGDIPAHLSGDEFAVLLPDTDQEGAKAIAERIRQAVYTRRIPVPQSPGSEAKTEITTQTSIGIAVAPVHAKTAEDLIDKADAALRKAKKGGRNRVEVADGEPAF
ncbi:MAG: GGDEF domain-containing protein [Treponema sp.]|jgi:diguanylate cyclase (GGDEF)-like protein|nr:GGDEF domain-containing protein [Treponema sp.]